MTDNEFWIWLAGFVDGEGCWKLYGKRPYFALWQKGANGRKMLQEIVTRLGWDDVKVTRDRNGWRFQVSALEKHLELVTLLLPYLQHQEKIAGALAIWELAVEKATP